MVNKNVESRRKLDTIVVVHFLDSAGRPKFYRELPPRMAYKSKRDKGKEFVVVTHKNFDYRVFVEMGGWRDGKAYRGSVKLKDGEHRNVIKVKTSVSIDRMQEEEIREISRTDRITYSEALRQVIEWGLEQAAKDERYAF